MRKVLAGVLVVLVCGVLAAKSTAYREVSEIAGVSSVSLVFSQVPDVDFRQCPVEIMADDLLYLQDTGQEAATVCFAFARLKLGKQERSYIGAHLTDHGWHQAPWKQDEDGWWFLLARRGQVGLVLVYSDDEGFGALTVRRLP